MIPRFARTNQPWQFKISKKPLPGYFFHQGRNALQVVLSVINKPQIAVPAFICPAVVDAVLAAKKKPVLLDVYQDLSLNLQQLAELVQSGKLGAVIVPHYFGYIQPLQKIKKLLQDKNIILIEDAAHLFPHTMELTGDLAIYSFNFDKPFTLGNGGEIVFKNKKIEQSFKKKYEKLKPVALAQDQRQLQILQLQTMLMTPEKYRRFHNLEEAEKYLSVPFLGWLLRRLLVQKKYKKLEQLIVKFDQKFFRFLLKLGHTFKPRGKKVLLNLARHGLYPQAKLRAKKELNRIKKIIKIYYKELHDCSPFGEVSELYKFPIFVGYRPEEFVTKAQNAGLELGNYNWPQAIHENKKYRKSCIINYPLTLSEYLAKHLIQLPIAPDLKPKIVKQVIDFVKNNIRSN